jgi:hypothetical protein
MALSIPIGETVVIRRVSATTPDERVSLGIRDAKEAKRRQAIVSSTFGVFDKRSVNDREG